MAAHRHHGRGYAQTTRGHKRYHDGLVRAALNCKPPDPEPGFRGSLDLVPPPESVEAASTPDADMALEDGELEEAAAKYAAALAELTSAEDEDERDGWTRAVLGLRRARALRKLRVFDGAARQIEEVRASHPRYADMLFESALLLAGQGRTDRGDGGFPGPRVRRSLVRGSCGSGSCGRARERSGRPFGTTRRGKSPRRRLENGVD